jgi:hypothetical protein
VLVIDYDRSAFRFREWFAEVLGTNGLDDLHALKGVNVHNYASSVNDLRVACESRIEGLQRLAESYIASEIVPRFGRLSGFQPVPTLRFHFAVMSAELRDESIDILSMSPSAFLAKYYFGGARVGMLHRDRDYGLMPGSVNLWIPVTDVFGSNSLWVGGARTNGRDAEPVTLRLGQALLFDGSNRWHGAIWNTSGFTRVSFDLRFFPEAPDGQVVVREGRTT